MRIILGLLSVIFGIYLLEEVINYECRGKIPKGLEGRNINQRAMFIAEVLAVVLAILSIIAPISMIIFS